MKIMDSISSAWIPEDDLLLKNSIETGASLEALAKGAVEFSRGYTLHEIRDRWHSLLYDPNVSVQASARMVEFELSGSNPSTRFSKLDNSKGSEITPEKLKKRNIRRQYYSMRKRIKNELFNTPDPGFFEKCSNFQDHVTINHEAQVDEDCLANNLGLEETDFEILRQAFPETMGAVPAASTTTTTVVATEACLNSVENVFINGSLLSENTDFINSSAVPEAGYSDLPDSLLNFSNEEDTPNMDVVSKDTMNYIPEDSLPNTDATPSIQFHEDSKDSSFHVAAQTDVPSTSDSFQLTEGKIICTLNTEDPEIPCNDDIFLLIHPSTLFAPVNPQPATDPIDPLSFSADEKEAEQGPSTVKDPAQMSDPGLPSETKCLGQVHGHDKLKNASLSRFLHANPVLVDDRLLVEDRLDTPTIYGEMSVQADIGSVMIDPQSMDNRSISDHNNSDSDGDIPDFSDIEAMILEMDLTYAQESCFSSEVARYQYGNSKRMIIRLEQTVRSSLQRAMSSRGALAIFYGRRLKYYIKKTEVIIGRSTGDADVDIDLRKEGRANMISRRQATIKMETDGSFALKNHGKSSISVNGNAIDPGQVASLGSSCLIEIRGMSFVFEINDKYVRRHLDYVIKKSQGKNTTFEWSP